MAQNAELGQGFSYLSEIKARVLSYFHYKLKLLFFCRQFARLYLWPSSDLLFEPRHEISNNVVCGTSKGSDQPVYARRLIRAFACHLNIL